MFNGCTATYNPSSQSSVTLDLDDTDMKVLLQPAVLTSVTLRGSSTITSSSAMPITQLSWMGGTLDVPSAYVANMAISQDAVKSSTASIIVTNSFSASGSGHLSLSSTFTLACSGTMKDFNIDGLGTFLLDPKNDTIGLSLSGTSTFNVHVQLKSGVMSVAPNANVNLYDFEWDHGTIYGTITLRGASNINSISYSDLGANILIQNYGTLSWTLPVALSRSIPPVGSLVNYPGASATLYNPSPSYVPTSLDNRGNMTFGSTGAILLDGIPFSNSGNVSLPPNVLVSNYPHPRFYYF